MAGCLIGVSAGTLRRFEPVLVALFVPRHRQALLLGEPSSQIDQSAALAAKRQRRRLVRIKPLSAGWALELDHPVDFRICLLCHGAAGAASVALDLSPSLDLLFDSAGLSAAAPFL